MKLKTVAMTGVLSLAGLGLIGAGAHAQFNTSTTSTQTINAGAPSVVLYNASATNNWNPTITLATPTDVGSSFTTGDQQVQMYNNGPITVTEATITLSASTTTGSDMYAGTDVCIATQYNNTVIYNGPLASVNGVQETYSGGGTIASGGSDYYYVNIYAGNEPTMCGNDTAGEYADSPGTDSPSSWASPLDSAAAGENVTVNLTVGYAA